MFLVGCKTPLQSFLGIAEQHGGPQNGVSVYRGIILSRGADVTRGSLEGFLLSMACVDLFCLNALPHGQGESWGPYVSTG